MTDARSVRDAVCEAMGSAVPEGFRPQATTPPTVAAGTDEPERVAVDRVAADTAVFDTDAATSYGDGVQHRLHLDRPTVASQGAAQHSERDGAAVEHYPSWRDDRAEVRFYWHPQGEANAEREAVRRARLSRWQEPR